MRVAILLFWLQITDARHDDENVYFEKNKLTSTIFKKKKKIVPETLLNSKNNLGTYGDYLTWL